MLLLAGLWYFLLQPKQQRKHHQDMLLLNQPWTQSTPNLALLKITFQCRMSNLLHWVLQHTIMSHPPQHSSLLELHWMQKHWAAWLHHLFSSINWWLLTHFYHHRHRKRHRLFVQLNPLMRKHLTPFLLYYWKGCCPKNHFVDFLCRYNGIIHNSHLGKFHSPLLRYRLL